MSLVRKILVPLDLSAAGLRACDVACELARSFDASVVLFQVVEPPPYVLPSDVTDAMKSATASELERRASELRPHVRELGVAVAEGDPAREIVRAVEAQGVDLVVMGTHGRRGVAYALLGSVADRVVRTSPRPVITVPAHAFEDRASAAKRLTQALADAGVKGPAVVALSRESIPIAAHAARALGGTLDVWPTAPVILDGSVVGAMGEDEHAVYDRPVAEAPGKKEAEERARATVREELAALRGTRSIGEVWKRPVVLVADGLAIAAPVTAAARALRAMGATEVVVAAPIAARAALKALGETVQRSVVLEAAVVANKEEAWYRDASLPPLRTLRQILDGEVDVTAST